MKNRFSILFLLISILISSCSSDKQKEYKLLEEYFKNEHDVSISKGINRVVIITDNDCSTCNEMFADYSLKNLNDDNTYILLTARGTTFDISPFQKQNKNIFIDWDLNPIKYHILENTGIIFLNANSIDTIINIDSYNLIDQMNYITEHIAN